MSSHSAAVSRTRPFYADHAQAYDLLITDPVEPWVQAVHERLTRTGRPAASILDAGCGTGRHAAALTDLGHHVDLVDAAEDLLRQAAARCPHAHAVHADLCTLDLGRQYQAVTCRGVLNDMVADTERDAALHRFAASLDTGGLLFLDVREERGSRDRADAAARCQTVQLDPDTHLEFASTVTWHAGLLHVHEQYTLCRGRQHAHESTYDFVMRPWTEDELVQRLSAAGFRAATLAVPADQCVRDLALAPPVQRASPGARPPASYSKVGAPMSVDRLSGRGSVDE